MNAINRIQRHIYNNDKCSNHSMQYTSKKAKGNDKNKFINVVFHRDEAPREKSVDGEHKRQNGPQKQIHHVL